MDGIDQAEQGEIIKEIVAAFQNGAPSLKLGGRIDTAL
jgi:hypothetical protein